MVRKTCFWKFFLDRGFVHEWIQKFYKMDNNIEEQMLRNDYMWFLRVQLDSRLLNKPFLSNPPKGTLLPIAEAVVVY